MGNEANRIAEAQADAEKQKSTRWVGKTLQFVSSASCPKCFERPGYEPADKATRWEQKCTTCNGSPRLPAPTRLFTYQESSTTSQCTVCQKNFSKFNRRHHCRGCGVVVCNSCSKGEMTNCPVQLGPARDGLLTDPKDAEKPQRCCDNCMSATANFLFGEAWSTQQQLMPADSRNFITNKDARYMPDNDPKVKFCCLLCAQPWDGGMGKSGKHHCRTCGIVCCDACSQSRVVIDSQPPKDSDRSCDQCLVKILGGKQKWKHSQLVDWQQRDADGFPLPMDKWTVNPKSPVHHILMEGIIDVFNQDGS